MSPPWSRRVVLGAILIAAVLVLRLASTDPDPAPTASEPEPRAEVEVVRNAPLSAPSPASDAPSPIEPQHGADAQRVMDSPAPLEADSSAPSLTGTVYLAEGGPCDDVYVLVARASDPAERAFPKILLDSMRRSIQRLCDPGEGLISPLWTMEGRGTFQRIVGAGRCAENGEFRLAFEGVSLEEVHVCALFVPPEWPPGIFRPSRRVIERDVLLGSSPLRMTIPVDEEPPFGIVRGRLVTNADPDDALWFVELLPSNEAGTVVPTQRLGHIFAQRGARTTGAGSEFESDGAFTFATVLPGAYYIRARHPKRGSTVSRPLEVRSGELTDVGDVRIEYPAGTASVFGHVMLPDEVDATRARVWLISVGVSERAIPARLVHLDAEGRFEVGGLPLGRWRLTGTQSGERTYEAPLVAIRGGSVELGERDRRVRMDATLGVGANLRVRIEVEEEAPNESDSPNKAERRWHRLQLRVFDAHGVLVGRDDVPLKTATHLVTWVPEGSYRVEFESEGVEPREVWGRVEAGRRNPPIVIRR